MQRLVVVFSRLRIRIEALQTPATTCPCNLCILTDWLQFHYSSVRTLAIGPLGCHRLHSIGRLRRDQCAERHAPRNVPLSGLECSKKGSRWLVCLLSSSTPSSDGCCPLSINRSIRKTSKIAPETRGNTPFSSFSEKKS